MFIGDLIKIKNKDNLSISHHDRPFVYTAIEEGWIWLITGMDDEDLDYVIQPLYLDKEGSNLTQLGVRVMVLYDDIEKVELSREELFKILDKQMCNC